MCFLQAVKVRFSRLAAALGQSKLIPLCRLFFMLLRFSLVKRKLFLFSRAFRNFRISFYFIIISVWLQYTSFVALLLLCCYNPFSSNFGDEALCRRHTYIYRVNSPPLSFSTPELFYKDTSCYKYITRRKGASDSNAVSRVLFSSLFATNWYRYLSWIGRSDRKLRRPIGGLVDNGHSPISTPPNATFREHGGRTPFLGTR